jgi:hypothetical protein
VAYTANGKKREPETLEELNKQLKYMEDLISQLKVNATKNESRTKSDVKLKTKENTQLIVDLNNLKYQSKIQQEQQARKREEDQLLAEHVKELKRHEAQLRHELQSVQVMRAKTESEPDDEDDKRNTKGRF